MPDTCPVCGSTVIVTTDEDGTAYYTPAPQHEATEQRDQLQTRLDSLRESVRLLISAYIADDDLTTAMLKLELLAGLKQQEGS